MGTRSTVAIVKEDGSVNSSYCHWDGYLDNNGMILFQHYQDPKKVDKLVSLGFMSALKKEVDFTGIHNYQNPQEDVTVFYGRDRGEKDVGFATYSSLDEYKKSGDFQEYNYVFNEKKKKWYVLNEESGKLETLASALYKNRNSLSNENREYLENYKKQVLIKREYKKMQKSIAEKTEDNIVEKKKIKF